MKGNASDVFNLSPQMGAFEVYCNGYLIHSKLSSGYWPWFNTVVNSIIAIKEGKAVDPPSRNLPSAAQRHFTSTQSSFYNSRNGMKSTLSREGARSRVEKRSPERILGESPPKMYNMKAVRSERRVSK